jgi:hypothetical protein
MEKRHGLSLAGEAKKTMSEQLAKTDSDKTTPRGNPPAGRFVIRAAMAFSQCLCVVAV